MDRVEKIMRTYTDAVDERNVFNEHQMRSFIMTFIFIYSLFVLANKYNTIVGYNSFLCFFFVFRVQPNAFVFFPGGVL